MTTPLQAAIAAFLADLNRQSQTKGSPFVGPPSSVVGDHRVFIDGVVDVEAALRAAVMGNYIFDFHAQRWNVWRLEAAL